MEEGEGEGRRTLIISTKWRRGNLLIKKKGEGRTLNKYISVLDSFFELLIDDFDFFTCFTILFECICVFCVLLFFFVYLFVINFTCVFLWCVFWLCFFWPNERIGSHILIDDFFDYVHFDVSLNEMNDSVTYISWTINLRSLYWASVIYTSTRRSRSD